MLISCRQEWRSYYRLFTDKVCVLSLFLRKLGPLFPLFSDYILLIEIISGFLPIILIILFRLLIILLSILYIWIDSSILCYLSLFGNHLLYCLTSLLIVWYTILRLSAFRISFLGLSSRFRNLLWNHWFWLLILFFAYLILLWPILSSFLLIAISIFICF